jgi:hypothetical protein
MPERTTDTIAGEVSFETVICSSCGDEIAKENAAFVVIADSAPSTTQSFSNLGKYTYRFRGSEPDEGWLCKFCHEEPAAYPHKNDAKSTGQQEMGRLAHLWKAIVG